LERQVTNVECRMSNQTFQSLHNTQIKYISYVLTCGILILIFGLIYLVEINFSRYI